MAFEWHASQQAKVREQVLCNAVERVERLLVEEKVYGSVPQEIPLLKTTFRMFVRKLADLAKFEVMGLGFWVVAESIMPVTSGTDRPPGWPGRPLSSPVGRLYPVAGLEPGSAARGRGRARLAMGYQPG